MAKTKSFCVSSLVRVPWAHGGPDQLPIEVFACALPAARPQITKDDLCLKSPCKSSTKDQFRGFVGWWWRHAGQMWAQLNREPSLFSSKPPPPAGESMGVECTVTPRQLEVH